MEKDIDLGSLPKIVCNDASDHELKHTFRVCNCSLLRLRAKPSLEADILDEILAGTVVAVDEKYTNKVFYRVNYNNRVGYCVKAFIEKI